MTAFGASAARWNAWFLFVVLWATCGIPGSSAGGRHLLAYPTSAVNGSASAAFPADTFGTWCSTDPTCTTVASSLGLSLLYYPDASAFTAATLNWPNVFSGTGVSDLQLVSGVLDLQFTGYSAKKDKEICDALTPCSAQLTVPLGTGVNTSLSFVCLRLEPRVTGSGYQAYGYPNGSYGTSISGSVSSGTLRCNTTKFGKHIVMQYKQTSGASPLPPSSSSSSSPPPGTSLLSPPPPPPPPVNASTAGNKYTYDVQLRMVVGLNLSFDSLKADAVLLSDLTASLESSLATTLRTVVRQQLGLPAAPVGSLLKISRSALDASGAVSVAFSLTVPAGATEGQVSSLTKLVVGDTAGLFAGSKYMSYLTAPASVSFVPTAAAEGLSVGALVGIAIAACIGTLLLLSCCYGIYQWRMFAAITPKKPEGAWDPTGLAAMPTRSGLRQRVARSQPTAEEEAPGGQGNRGPGAPGPASAVPPAGGGDSKAPWAGGGGSGEGGQRGDRVLTPSREAWM